MFCSESKGSESNSKLGVEPARLETWECECRGTGFMIQREKRDEGAPLLLLEADLDEMDKRLSRNKREKEKEGE